MARKSAVNATSESLLLPVWQQVCRHLEISESAQAIATLLGEYLPLHSLVLRRLEPEHRRVRTVANSVTRPVDNVPGDVHLSAADWKRLERWARQRRAVHKAADPRQAESILGLLEQPTPRSDLILAPLWGEHGSCGILSALAASGKRFSDQHVALLSALQEPLAVALDNDSRLHELAALREAAVADRQSLLRRLGRQEVGETIVGEDSGLAQVMQRVDMISRSDVPALILGETGTGKELVARAIHNRSDRHAGPFMRVNCGAIPRELIDSQLFGHERGSFTGASETRHGWFERADMGTLFLDEIGELPLDAQVRFLRVLQDGFIERVGGTKPIRVNVRVVAATHRDLAVMARASTFREDLWYRIAVFPILLPPLRDRVEDIRALARHFAERAAVRFGLAPVVPNDAEIELLQSYNWPGNIRELGAVIDRAAILGNGQTLELATALGLSVPRRSDSMTLLSDKSAATPVAGSRAIASLDDAMRRHIEAALRATHGRIEGDQGAARLLKINPHTLRARMRKLRVNWAAFRYPPEAK
ncbi:MAG: sigma 54-interacting transcriptional regulator [Pirellulales bacterium]